jgi:hypothetical protein
MIIERGIDWHQSNLSVPTLQYARIWIKRPRRTRMRIPEVMNIPPSGTASPTVGDIVFLKHSFSPLLGWEF